MTKEQSDTATVWIYAGFCLAMVGAYAWSCWQGVRNQRRLNDRLAAAAEYRYQPSPQLVPRPGPRRAKPADRKIRDDTKPADDQV